MFKLRRRAPLHGPENPLADIKGGVTAALTAIPIELVYGLFAVAPLGAAFAEHGVRAALWGCILGGILGFLLRGTGGMMVGSRPATGLILGSLAAMLLRHPAVTSASDPAALVFSLLLVCTALAGLFQYLFGVAHVGRALRYVPFPVTAGLMLGVGMLMIQASLRPALGATNQLAWTGLLDAWHPASVVVSASALALCVLGTRLKTRVPGSVLALLLGSLLHHGLVLILGADHLGGTVSSLSGLLPEYVVWGAEIDLPGLIGWLPVLASYALTIAALGSLETLLCLSMIGSAQAKRPDGNGELRVQGLSNLIGGLFGATASVGNLARVKVNLSAGGRSGWSGIAYALTLALVVVLAGGFLSLVPQAVTAGIVIYYAFGMVDDGTRRITQQIVVQRKQVGRQYYRVLLSNFTIILLVASVAVLGDMMKAAVIGLVAAMFLFFSNRINPTIRRVTLGDRRRSLKTRAAADVDLLGREGMRIGIIEVDGPLFFGTADRIADEIEKLMAQVSLVIIDLKRVPDIDPTGARTLLQVSERLAAKKKELLLSGLNPLFEHFLQAMGLDKAVPALNWHHDLDHALEDAEDRLLTQLGGHASHHALAFGQTALAAGLDLEQISTLQGFLLRRVFDSPVELFHKDDEGASLFVVESSSVDILLPLADGKHKRIVSLAPGVIFGEMALLEGKPRSTTAALVGPSVVWELTRDAFDALLQSHPLIARQVLFNVGRQLAGRLRAITSELTMLLGE